eukprot:g24771.t1
MDHPALGVIIPGLVEAACQTVLEVKKLIKFGLKKRVTSATIMNNTSSRSHAVFIIKVQRVAGEGRVDSTNARMNLVDLAGSERHKAAFIHGATFKEGCAINQSLSALALVIKELGEQQARSQIRPRTRSFSGALPMTATQTPMEGKEIGDFFLEEAEVVPFRSSKLTFLLRDSLAGNSRSRMVAAVSPAACNVDETIRSSVTNVVHRRPPDPQDAVEDLHEEQVKDQRHAVVQQEDQVDAPPPAARRARIDPSAVRRMVSSHMARDREPLEPVEPEGGQGGQGWGGALGRAGAPGSTTRAAVGGASLSRQFKAASPSTSAKRSNRGARAAQQRALRELDDARSAASQREAEFDLVHAVVALHRIAKSTDYRELQDDARRRSGGRRSGADASELRGQLAALAAKAAEEVQPGGDGELPHVKEAWSFAIARPVPGASAAQKVAEMALRIFPDFQAQGLANTAWAMARLLADPEGSSERRLLDCIAQEVAKNARDFTPQGLANIGWAFATLVCPESKFKRLPPLDPSQPPLRWVFAACPSAPDHRMAMDNEGWQTLLQEPMLSLEDDLSLMLEQQQSALRAAMRAHQKSMLKLLGSLRNNGNISPESQGSSESLLSHDASAQILELREADLIPSHGGRPELRQGRSRALQPTEYRSCLDSPLGTAVAGHQPILSESLEVELPPSPHPEADSQLASAKEKKKRDAKEAKEAEEKEKKREAEEAKEKKKREAEEAKEKKKREAEQAKEKKKREAKEAKDEKATSKSTKKKAGADEDDAKGSKRKAKQDEGDKGKKSAKKKDEPLEDLVPSGSDDDTANNNADLALNLKRANTAQIEVEEKQPDSPEMSVGLKQDPTWCSFRPALQVLEHFFVVIFALELFYRIYRVRWEYFRDPWNLMDAGLVLIAVADLYVLEPIFKNTPTSNAVAFRVFRVIKLEPGTAAHEHTSGASVSGSWPSSVSVRPGARVIRIVRALRLFRGLRVLVHACCSFLPSLSWSMALLSLCMLSGGLLMGNLLQDFINDEEADIDHRTWIWMHYGTSYRAIYTMYEMTFAGNWPIYARPVIENVSHVFVLFYITYITFIVFAVIRVITAIFLRETLEAANNDAELMEGLRRKATYIHKLESIFNAVDESQDGLLSEEELNELFRDSRVTTYLETLDIDVQQSEALFHLLANGHGEITCADFIDGILRCVAECIASPRTGAYDEGGNSKEEPGRCIRSATWGDQQTLGRPKNDLQLEWLSNLSLSLSLVDRPSASIEADVVEAPEVLRARERSSRAKMKVERSVEPVEKVRRRLRHKQPCEAYGAGVFKRRRFS